MAEAVHTGPSPDHIRAVFARYGALLTAGDLEGIVALYAPDAILRDPVTAPPICGHAAIRAFYQAGFEAAGGAIEMTLDGAVRIAGNHGAAAYIARTVHADPVYRTETLDTMTFDDNGLIAAMTAYWGPENASLSTEDDTTPATLAAERAIKRRLFAIARAMDERDWSALDAILLPDATADFGTGPLEGRDAIVGLMRSYLDACGPSQHMLGNIVIAVAGDEARSAAYINDRHVGAGDKSALSFATLGEYRDIWRKVDGRWRLLHRTKTNGGHIGSMEALGPGPA